MLGAPEEHNVLEQRVLSLVEDRLHVALHEIRQPLAAVLALAEAAACTGDVTPAVRHYLDRIVEQVQEVSGAACSVLGCWDAEERSEAATADLDEVLDSVLEAVGLTWAGSLARWGDPGPAVVRGDRTALRRCLVNVVENAVRAAGPDGRVAVTVERLRGAVRVLVEDDGPGFGRVPTGTGVGLVVTRRALDTLGGRLWTGPPSSLGGARVALDLPVASAGDVDEPVSVA